MKSKKNKKSKYSKQDLDIKKVLVIDASDLDKKYPMIDRKATQQEIDKDKKIKALLEKNAYDLNQIAGMLMLPLERVKKVKENVSRKN
jgi:hypothetical protein